MRNKSNKRRESRSDSRSAASWSLSIYIQYTVYSKYMEGGGLPSPSATGVRISSSDYYLLGVLPYCHRHHHDHSQSIIQLINHIYRATTSAYVLREMFVLRLFYDTPADFLIAQHITHVCAKWARGNVWCMVVGKLGHQMPTYRREHSFVLSLRFSIGTHVWTRRVCWDHFGSGCVLTHRIITSSIDRIYVYS